MKKATRVYATSGLLATALFCIVGFQNCGKMAATPNLANSSSTDLAVTPAPSIGLPATPTPTGGTATNVNQSSSCPTAATAAQTMAIQSPCSTNLITANQLTNPTVIPVAITDQNAILAPAAMPIQVTAPGMLNVEVWAHGAKKIALTQAGTSGVFTGALDLSKEPAGPMHLRFYAWDVTAGGNPTVKLSAELSVFVSGTRLPIPTLPVGAAGMTMKWSDRFTKLSSAICNPGTGKWPSCTIATAAGSGATWWENTPGGGDFGDAAFEHSDGAYNPFAILPTGGMLRIRATYDANYKDPYNYGRKWYGGMLATAFGPSLPYTTNIPLFTDGYYESRILAPNAACGTPWSGKCSGATWPAFWQLSFNSNSANGAIELDTTELYGEDPGYQQSATHAYSPATAPPPDTGGAYIYQQNPMPDLTWDFHRFGLLVQDSATANGTVCNYVDDVKLGCAPMPRFPTGVAPQWYFLLNLAMGAGWPLNSPPLSNQYDMFIDYVAAWAR